MAEQEREALSKRTKEVLAAARARGVQLGAYRDGAFVGRVGTAEDVRKASQARSQQYRRVAEEKLSLLARIDPDGSLSLRAIAERLNATGVTTVSGNGSWLANSVRRLKALPACGGPEVHLRIPDAHCVTPQGV